jgi:peptidyl-Asp metalloendopeptidase
VQQGDIWAGSIVRGNDVVRMIINADGTTLTSEQSSFPRERGVPIPAEGRARSQREAAAAPSDAVEVSRRADDGSEFTVLFAYTQAACCAVVNLASTCTLAQCQAQTEAAIALATDETNQGFINSGINIRMRTLGSMFVSYDEVGTFENHLDRLTDRAPTDNIMNDVHAERDRLGADLVSLIVKDDTYCGIGWLDSDAAYAFTAVSETCLTGDYTVAHEIGHNIGCEHDRVTERVPTSAAYNFGYQSPTRKFQ